MKKELVMVKVLLLAFVLTSHGQLIDNELGNAFEDEMFFNEAFIANNEIVSVTGESWVKRNGESMKKQPGSKKYIFGEAGKLQKLYKVKKMFGELDTLHILWDYNSEGDVVTKVEKDKRGFYAERNEYGESDLLQERRYYRYINKSGSRDEFSPKKEYLINKEQFEHRRMNDTVKVQTTLNNYGLPYKKLKTTWSSSGYLLSELLEYTISGQKVRTSYSYNNNGWISSLKQEHQPEGNTDEKKFVYDKMGNLLFIDHFKNGIKTHRTELIYDEGMLLHSTIHRELASNIMNITKFYYTFEQVDKK